VADRPELVDAEKEVKQAWKNKSRKRIQ
jgi:hypothetical protein